MRTVLDACARLTRYDRMRPPYFRHQITGNHNVPLAAQKPGCATKIFVAKPLQQIQVATKCRTLYTQRTYSIYQTYGEQWQQYPEIAASAYYLDHAVVNIERMFSLNGSGPMRGPIRLRETRSSAFDCLDTVQSFIFQKLFPTARPGTWLNQSAHGREDPSAKLSWLKRNATALMHSTPDIYIFLRYARTLGPSSSLDPVIFLVKTFKLYEILPFNIKLATAVLETPTRSKFHSNWKTLNTDLVPSRLCKILWQDMLWDIGTGSHCKINVPNLWGTVITHHTKKTVNPLRAKFFRENINTDLHFRSLLHIDMTQVHKQRVLMHRHQRWNVRHGLCHIYMRYIYIWVVYSFCLFCCLFIIVTWWYIWCIVWQVASKRKYRHVW